MTNRYYFLILFLIGCNLAFAQLPDTDIFIADMKLSDTGITFSKAVNMTRRNGYDNQPFFSQDGLSFYFTAINKDTTQSDIYRCDMFKKTIVKVTSTPTSEYSPQLSPDGTMLGVVRVDADSGQRFYSIPVNDTRISMHVDHSDSIGYFTWLTDSTIAMFILGETNSLQLLNNISGERTYIAPSIGRCLKTDFKREYLYFTNKGIDTTIQRLHLTDFKIEKVTDVISGSEDFAVLKDNSLLMGKSGVLYHWSTAQPIWNPVADFKPSLTDFYRISVSPSNDRIAVVAFTGKKP